MCIKAHSRTSQGGQGGKCSLIWDENEEFGPD